MISRSFSPGQVSPRVDPQEIRPVLKAVDGEGNDSSSIDARRRDDSGVPNTQPGYVKIAIENGPFIVDLPI